jgi:cytochrome c5
MRLLAAVLFCIAVTAVHPQNIEGQQLFDRKCGICHAEGGTGAIMLGRRLGKDGAILARRTDLQGPYVEAIARSGLRSMPPLSRVEVPDSQLSAIASYLVRPNSRTRAGAGP